MLNVRVLSAVIAIIALILIFWIGGFLIDLVLIIIALIGTREVYNAFVNRGMHPSKLAGYTAVILFYVQNLLANGKYDFLYILIATLLILSMSIWKSPADFANVAVTMLGIFYPGILLGVVQLMKEATIVHPYYLIYLSLTAAYATDTFAFFVGSALGKKKLCPDISPNKTVEGSIGGLAGGIFAVILLGIALNWVYNINVNLIHYAFIGLLAGIFSQLGDLTASSIKRYCDIKDFGRIIPGHGGIMDRIDSLLFVLPVVYLYSQLFLS